MLTPEAIYRIPDADLADLGGNPRAIREQAATRLLGTILEETDIAVIEPGARERARMMRSEESRAGKEGGSTCSTPGAPYNKNKNKKDTQDYHTKKLKTT